MKATGGRWYLDSGCSKHMTGDKTKFISLQSKNGGGVTFGGSGQGKIIGIGKIGKNSSTSIDNVLLVEGLNHNLLSISQLCEKNNRVIFNSEFCIVENMDDNKIKLVGQRINNVYTINLDDEMPLDSKCLISVNNDSWL